MRALREGVRALREGMRALREEHARAARRRPRAARKGMRALREGMRALREGVRALREGVRALREGVRALREGVRALREGMRALREGMRALREGVRALREGMRALREGVRAVREGERPREPRLPAPREEGWTSRPGALSVARASSFDAQIRDRRASASHRRCGSVRCECESEHDGKRRHRPRHSRRDSPPIRTGFSSIPGGAPSTAITPTPRSNAHAARARAHVPPRAPEKRRRE